MWARYGDLTVYKSLLILITIFAVAIANLESAVAVSLKKVCYPDGFESSLVAIPDLMAFTELGVATLVMLVVIV